MHKGFAGRNIFKQKRFAGASLRSVVCNRGASPYRSSVRRPKPSALSIATLDLDRVVRVPHHEVVY
jgi:hypothetical protein